MDTTILDRYVGRYSIASMRVLTITRDGDQLSAQISGQPKLPICPETSTKFCWRVVDAQVTFALGDRGRATSATIHQGGRDILATRVDESAARATEKKLANRVSQQLPQPGSEAALQKSLAAISAGTPNYDDMTPSLQNIVRRQLPVIAARTEGRGPIQVVEFKGVSESGTDQYIVTYQNGKQSQCLIELDGDGKIALLALLPRF